MIALAALSTVLAAGPEVPAWDWAEGGARRYYVDVEVHLPYPILVTREFNRGARLVAYKTELILDCAPAGPPGRRGWEILCTIDDVSLVGASMGGDVGRLGDVLTELDERLTGAVLQLDWRADGRIVNVDLEGVDRRNRRTSQNVEMLRLMLSRAIAGFDLRFPRPSEPMEPGWGQSGGMLLSAPYRRGSQGSGEQVHRVLRVQDGLLVIETAGRGIVAPATDGATGPANLYDTELEALARFDPASGGLVQRRWTAVGTPTAGSAVTDGTRGIDYLQAGYLVLLDDGIEPPTLRLTGEAAAPGTTPSALQRWIPIPTLGSHLP